MLQDAYYLPCLLDCRFQSNSCLLIASTTSQKSVKALSMRGTDKGSLIILVVYNVNDHAAKWNCKQYIFKSFCTKLNVRVI